MREINELKIIGIDEKGYGKVYKAVMRNSDVPLTAKALYAYFCSYAGSGTTAFPHREKIIRDLKITKNTFTKHLNFLVDARYIARQRTTIGNLYEILLTVPDKDGEMVEAKSLGYGTIPKLVMLDDRLTVSSKGIYAYLCSYAGSGHVAYPRGKTILRELSIGRDKYYKHFTPLVELGYITPTQNVEENGRYGTAVYALNEELGINPRNCSKDNEKTASECDSQKPVHGDGESASECDSQKSVHGGKPSDSQELIHGDFTGFNNVFNRYSQKPVHGEGAMSQKAVSRKTVYGFLGHPNINNSSYNKQSSSIEEDDISNIPAHAHAREEDDTTCDTPSLSKKEVKELCHYEYLLSEFEAWATLKNTLGHFSSPSMKAVFLSYCRSVCNELVHQLSLFFDRKAEQFEHNGRRYERTALFATLREKLADRDNVFEAVCYIADNRSEVKSVRGYVKQMVINLATEV